MLKAVTLKTNDTQEFLNFHFPALNFCRIYYSNEGPLLITVIYVDWHQPHMHIPQLLIDIYCYMATNCTAVTLFYGLNHIACVIYIK